MFSSIRSMRISLTATLNHGHACWTACMARDASHRCLVFVAEINASLLRVESMLAKDITNFSVAIIRARARAMQGQSLLVQIEANRVHSGCLSPEKPRPLTIVAGSARNRKFRDGFSAPMFHNDNSALNRRLGRFLPKANGEITYNQPARNAFPARQRCLNGHLRRNSELISAS